MAAEIRKSISRAAGGVRPAVPPARPLPSRRIGSIVAVVLIAFAACSTDGAGDGPSTTAPTTPPATSVPAPKSCDGPGPLFLIESVVAKRGGSCFEWVNRAYGRAVRASTGSATVWSRRTEFGTVLIVGAVHTLGEGWFGPSNTAVTESMVDPGDWTGVPRLFLIRPDGTGPDDLASPWFALYKPAIAAERNNNFMRDLLPREDFYVAVADAQKLDVSGLPPAVEPIRPEPVPLYDPGGSLTTYPTWAEAYGGDLVLLLGYPQTTGQLSAGVGRVLSDQEARQAVERLAALGDSEGAIAYDAEVEMIIKGEAVAGMSGGGAVDRDGRLVGVLVRATDNHDGDQYVRAVRMSWVTARISAAFERLDSPDQDAIRRYLESAENVPTG